MSKCFEVVGGVVLMPEWLIVLSVLCLLMAVSIVLLAACARFIVGLPAYEREMRNAKSIPVTVLS